MMIEENGIFFHWPVFGAIAVTVSGAVVGSVTVVWRLGVRVGRLETGLEVLGKDNADLRRSIDDMRNRVSELPSRAFIEGQFLVLTSRIDRILVARFHDEA